MSNDTINIQVDLSFFEADLIGEYSLPVVFKIDPATATLEDTTITYVRAPSVSGVKNEVVDFYSMNTTFSGSDNWEVEYSSISGIDSFIDLNNEYFVKTGDVTVYGADAGVDFIAGDQYENTFNYRTTYLIPIKYDTNTNHETIYNYIASKDLDLNITTQSEFDSLYTNGINNAWVDAEFGGWIPHVMDVDLISSLFSIKPVNFDMETTTSGNLENYILDILCCVEKTPSFFNDIFCSVSGIKDINFDLKTINNVSINCIVGDNYCVLRGLPSVKFDVNLFPIKILNFIPVEGNYSTADSLIAVDVVDDSHNITTSGTYFIIGGTMVSGITYTPIIDGYRLYYDSPIDYNDVTGAIEVKVHAENDNGNILEKDFYLTYGYKIIYEG